MTGSEVQKHEKEGRPEVIERPKLKGRGVMGAVAGRVLTVWPGVWTTNVVEFAYQWMRNGAKITDANEQTYEPGPHDVGSEIACVVGAKNSSHLTMVSSDRLMVVNDPRPLAVIEEPDLRVIEGSLVEVDPAGRPLQDPFMMERPPMLLVSVAAHIRAEITLEFLRDVIGLSEEKLEAAKVIMISRPKADIAFMLKADAHPGEELEVELVNIG